MASVDFPDPVWPTITNLGRGRFSPWQAQVRRKSPNNGNILAKLNLKGVCALCIQQDISPVVAAISIATKMSKYYQETTEMKVLVCNTKDV